MFLEYLKENPILTAVLAASLAVIFIVIVAMVVKNAKAKKKNASDAASAAETNDTNALSSASEEKETCVRPAYEAAPEAIGTQPIVPGRGDERGRACPRRANERNVRRSGSRGAPRTARKRR